MTDLPADEHLVAFGLIVDHAHLLRHSVLDHHRPGQGRRLLDVLGSPCGDIIKNKFLRDTPSQRHHDGLKHLAFRVEHLVFLRQGHGVARRPGSCGDNGDSVHRTYLRKKMEQDGVARFMVGGDLLLLLGNHPAFLLRPDSHLNK